MGARGDPASRRLPVAAAMGAKLPSLMQRTGVDRFINSDSSEGSQQKDTLEESG